MKLVIGHEHVFSVGVHAFYAIRLLRIEMLHAAVEPATSLSATVLRPRADEYSDQRRIPPQPRDEATGALQASAAKLKMSYQWKTGSSSGHSQLRTPGGLRIGLAGNMVKFFLAGGVLDALGNSQEIIGTAQGA